MISAFGFWQPLIILLASDNNPTNCSPTWKTVDFGKRPVLPCPTPSNIYIYNMMIHGYTCIHALQYFTIRMTSTSHCITVRVRVHLKKHIDMFGVVGGLFWTHVDSFPARSRFLILHCSHWRRCSRFQHSPLFQRPHHHREPHCQRAGWCQYLRVIGAPVTHSLNIINAHQELMNTNLV